MSLAEAVFSRTYSRRKYDGSRESWTEVCDRTVRGLQELGGLNAYETQLIRLAQEKKIAFTSGRWLWVGGTNWIEKPENFYGAYNCSSTNVVDWKSFGLLMNLAAQGCGTGAVLEERYINQLPPICNKLNIKVVGEIGLTPEEERNIETIVYREIDRVSVYVGDSRQGWVKSYQTLLELASDTSFDGEIDVFVNLSDVRPAGERLKGFGGVANPVKLPQLYDRVATILNKAVGRQLNVLECCLLIDEAALVIVAGNLRRSAGMRQADKSNQIFASAKDNLWQEDSGGNWRIDPERDALRMANHTRVYHQKPTLEECVEAVRKQYYSGEGAIQWAGEAIARANADILLSKQEKLNFLKVYDSGNLEDAKHYLGDRCQKYLDYYPDDEELEHRISRYGLNPCGEIVGSNFFCNLGEVHLPQIHPEDFAAQEDAFHAAAISVAVLLNHKFAEPRYQYSRELDPIVGVSFTGLFDFFVNAFGVDWLRWWEQGRSSEFYGELPQNLIPIANDLHINLSKFAGEKFNLGNAFKAIEAAYLNYWRTIVEDVVWDYCDRHKLKHPNRCTTQQPAGSKSLLTGASPGCHPPKAARFIRRVTFAKNDPVALACKDLGFNVIPAQSDKDENGNLLNDPFDPRCTEWLVEFPTQAIWASLPGADEIDISRFSALAQLDFFMQVQKHYVRHNTSATIELRENEIEALGNRIYEAIRDDEGYISAALLARFDDLQTFPRLPFEPIDKTTYDRLSEEVAQRQTETDFSIALAKYDNQQQSVEAQGPAGCDSDKCLFEAKK